MTRVFVFNTHPKYKVNKSIFKQLARSVFSREGARTAKCNVVFVGDKRMIVLNSTYLGHEYTTDVLSFPLRDHDDGGVEGEVYINIDQARRQARSFHVTINSELARLVIHGILHLLGYRDDTKRQKTRMLQREDHYLLLLL